jgi:hypothetical protein
MNLYGQTFTPSIIDRIRESIAECATITRSVLSRNVCDWLNWQAPNGKPKEVSSRKALLELERQGLIKLPAAKSLPPQSREPLPRPAYEREVFVGELNDLGTVELLPVEGGSEYSSLWNQMMDSHHPQGGGPLCGAQQRYLVRSSKIGWLGGLAFSAAAWHLASRDDFIGWCAHARRANLPLVLNNSRFLILPHIRVKNLGSHILGKVKQQVVDDWERRYKIKPVLLETFVDEKDYLGTVYQASNWRRIGETTGRGRQDTHGLANKGRKAVYVFPLQDNWRMFLCQLPKRMLRLAEQDTENPNWAEQEFGGVNLPDGRLRPRLLSLAEDFFRHPSMTLTEALGGDVAKTKAAYRFFKNPQVNLQTLLHSHYEATVTRIAAQPVVLVAQDTTSLNYAKHHATTGLGPINTRADGALGLKLHDSIALTPEGVPLGLVDIEAWARDPLDAGKSKERKKLPIEKKESQRWLNSYRRTAEIQQLCPQTKIISIADREADIFELFQEVHATKNGPDVLIRASRTTQRSVVDEENEINPLWDYIYAKPVEGGMRLAIPSKGDRKARVAELDIRYAQVELCPPKRLSKSKPITLWAVYALEANPPKDCEATEWLLLTTVPTLTLADAFERLSWYACRWNIEIFHRTLKSGCHIEDRRNATAESLEACLALDLVVAWRIMYLTKLGRETPNVSCRIVFEDAEWQALCCYHARTPNPPETPPTLGEAVRIVAKLGGFLGRKSDGDPGATYMWRGLDHISFITDTYLIYHPEARSGP